MHRYRNGTECYRTQKRYHKQNDCDGKEKLILSEHRRLDKITSLVS